MGTRPGQVARQVARQWAWFIGLWAASVTALGVVAGVLRLALKVAS